MFVRITNDLRNAGQGRDLAGGALSVTTRNYYLATGILAADAPDAGSGILLSRSSDSAGVKHHELCISTGPGPFESLIEELSFNCGTLSLGGAASEILYVKTGHRTILAYVHLSMYDFGRGSYRAKRVLSSTRYS